MRPTMAEMTAKMKRWSVRIALDDETTLAARGSPFALLQELLAGPKTTLLMVLATGTHHFNALDQLSRACMQQRIWSAVLKPSAQGVKQLVVYVPRFSAAGKVSEEVQTLARSMQISISLNVVNCEDVPRFVYDALISSMLMHEMETAGCTIVGEASERQVVLSPDIFKGEISTVAVPEIQWQYDSYRRSCSVELTCIPVVMKLSTIAEDTDVDSQGDEEELPQWPSSNRVHVLPRLSEGWVISRFAQQNAPTTSSHEVATGPHTDEDFRSYWVQVHGIHLPARFGGYVRIRFSSDSVLTYPACCVATEWRPLCKQTRVEALEVLRDFAAICRSLYGGDSVSLSSPQDQPQKRVVLLPASALVESELANQSEDHQRNSDQTPTKAKRRMIARDRYAAA